MPFPLDKSVAPNQKSAVLPLGSLATLIMLPLFWWIEVSVGETSSFTALALYLPQHYYLVLPLIFGAWALFARQFRAVALNVVSLLFCLFFPLGWRVGVPQSPPSTTVRIVTFNVQRGEGDMSRVDATLQGLHPDIICLQESGISSRPAHNDVGRHVATKFPGWSAHYAGDVTTLSRFPVASERIYPLRGTRRTLETVVQTPRGQLRVLNTHVSTSFQGNRAPKSQLDRFVVLWETAQPSAQVRLDQLPAIRRAIESNDAQTPLILAGDFNTPPRGRFYAGLKRDLNDAFAEAGSGTGYSFPSRLPLLRIDYVWTRRATAKQAFVGDASGSDHRPLIADVEVGS